MTTAHLNREQKNATHHDMITALSILAMDLNDELEWLGCPAQSTIKATQLCCSCTRSPDHNNCTDPTNKLGISSPSDSHFDTHCGPDSTAPDPIYDDTTRKTTHIQCVCRKILTQTSRGTNTRHDAAKTHMAERQTN